MSLLNRVSYVLTCQRALRAYVFMCQCALRASVLTYQRALNVYVLACQCARVLTCSSANVLCAYVFISERVLCALVLT